MNRNIILFIAMSLDGYVAEKEGGVEWLAAGQVKSCNEDNAYIKFLNSVDTIVMGRTTYNQLKEAGWPYRDKKCYVFTSSPYEKDPDVEFIQDELEDFVKKLKAEDGKNVWIAGGAKLASLFINSDFIDEYHITVMPVILGDGIKLFDGPSPQIPLKYVSSTEFDGTVTLTYVKK